jgi:hypothetical protein
MCVLILVLQYVFFLGATLVVSPLPAPFAYTLAAEGLIHTRNFRPHTGLGATLGASRLNVAAAVAAAVGAAGAGSCEGVSGAQQVLSLLALLVQKYSVYLRY